MADLSTRIIGHALTFDDVLLVPDRAALHPSEIDVTTQFTRDIRINIPFVSAPMDTVTESSLAIALAQEGGIGIIHRNLSVEDQKREVRKVKRSESGVILDPVTLRPEDTVAQATEIMRLHNVSGIPITKDGGILVGILTRRDLKFLDVGSTKRVGEVMTRDGLVCAPPDTALEQADQLLKEAKVEKLLLVDRSGKLTGLITMRDIERAREYPQRCKDQRGRLRVGAAVGVHDYERAASLVAADVDVLAVDTAHGHSDNVIDTVRELKRQHSISVIAGNIATAAAARALIEAGADAVKVGIGPGAICTTRVVTGVGIPQITAIMDCVGAADVPVIADGGVRFSGDAAKAIAAGAGAVMIGSLFAGLDESPGQVVLWKGRRYKEYRGMGSLAAMQRGSAERYSQSAATTPQKMVPEGVEGRVPYRGPLSEFVYQLVGGLRQAMGYCGVRDIAEFRQRARFVQVTAAGVAESHPHDIRITREPPNYALDFTGEE